MKKKLLMMSIAPTSMTYKMLYFLRNYLDITLISLSRKDKYPEEIYKKLGIKVYSFNFGGQGYWKNKNIFLCLKEILKFVFNFAKIKREKYDFVLAKTEPNYIGYILFKIFKN